MSIYTNLAHKLSKEDYKLVVEEINKWCDLQAKDYANSVFVYPAPAKAYKQALQHLKFSLIDTEEQI